MSALDRILIGCILAAGLLLGGFLWVQHYGLEQYQAGQAAAVAAGEKLRQAEADRNHTTEAELRASLAAADTQSHQKEIQHAQDLDAAQRRMRAGTDRLRCPASQVPAGAVPDDRPAAAGPEPDTTRAELVPDAAADLLGIAADAAGLVRKFDRLSERFEACRALNAVP